jgi:hypothetical protein
MIGTLPSTRATALLRVAFRGCIEIGRITCAASHQSLRFCYVDSNTYVGVQSTSGDCWLAPIESVHHITKSMRALVEKIYAEAAEENTDAYTESDEVRTNVGRSDKGVHGKVHLQKRVASSGGRLGGSTSGGVPSISGVRRSVRLVHR